MLGSNLSLEDGENVHGKGFKDVELCSTVIYIKYMYRISGVW
jgi:hypothetical protein